MIFKTSNSLIGPAQQSAQASESIHTLLALEVLPVLREISSRISTVTTGSAIPNMTQPATVNMDLLLRDLARLAARWPHIRKPSTIPQKDEYTRVPDVTNISRIVGSTEAARPDARLTFLSTGFSDITCIINIAETYGIKFAGESSVMDWGVGCGRMARHLPMVLRNNFCGCDVDPINVDWCKRYMPFGQYFQIPTHPDAEVFTKQHDLIYSHSVLTHLSEDVQHLWLEQLARALKPKGLALLTVHGLVSNARIAEWAKEAPLFNMWLERGFVDSPTPNPDINDVTDIEYYRDVAHTPEYIFSNWSKYFDVLDIIPGAIAQIQDVVVCRSK
jgi:hypothetical protein